jgi:hypothetical protein
VNEFFSSVESGRGQLHLPVQAVDIACSYLRDCRSRDGWRNEVESPKLEETPGAAKNINVLSADRNNKPTQKQTAYW